MPISEVDLSQDGTVEKPINREPSMQELISSFLTKSDNYDRNHGPLQHRIATDHVVTIDGLVSTNLKLAVTQLIANYPQHKVTAALQCAGNRRHTMRTQIKEVQGVDWFDAAMMNCSWEGPRLRDVLQTAGVGGPLVPGNDQTHEDSSASADVKGSSTSPALHVQFASYGTKTQEDDWYGGSIPLERAMDPEMDVILAVKMNNEPLPSRHGFPVRAIVPGVLGARSVKWLDRITIASEESSCFYQRHDYKVLPPDAVDGDSAEKYWSSIPAMLEMPVNACVAYPASESSVKVDEHSRIKVQGYAVPQGSQGPVVRVEVSGDEGATWVDARLDYGPDKLKSKWSWVLWEAVIVLQTGKDRKIFAKATDTGGNTQTEERSQWNLRGVAYNGYEAVWGLTVGLRSTDGFRILW